jgi:GT2 family glycosyltransferase
MMQKKILVILVTYNGERWIRKCLDSLVQSSYPIEKMIIDNGSSDNTVDIIKEAFRDIELIENNCNLGFGMANNIGLQKVLNKNYDFAFLLNQDAWIESDTIENLIDSIEQDTEIGILSPLHFTGSGDKFDLNFMRYIFQSPEFCNDLDSKKQEMQEFYEVPFVNAAAWLIRKECIQKIGFFDPIFFHYGEDQNYCQRVRYHHLKVAISPYAAIYHDREFRDNSTISSLIESSDVLVELCNINDRQVNIVDNYISTRRNVLEQGNGNERLTNQIQIATEKYELIYLSRNQNCVSYTKT